MHIVRYYWGIDFGLRQALWWKIHSEIEDTNSDNIDSDAYDMLPKDAEWIFGNVTEVWINLTA